MENITFEFKKNVDKNDIHALFNTIAWAETRRPKDVVKAVKNSHRVITAWDGKKLVGASNTLSDDTFVVFYAYLLVHPSYQHMGVGTEMMKRLMQEYKDYPQQLIIADNDAIGFYEKLGFSRAGATQSMWLAK